jgi:RNA polymerase sigma-70 factor, ECF subfamily
VRTKQLERAGHIDDQALVARCRKGDGKAFASLVERYQRRVFGLALGITRDAEEARDIVQEAFLRVHRSLARFRGDSSFSTWLYRISYNLSIEVVRRRRRRSAIEGWSDAVPPAAEQVAKELMAQPERRPSEAAVDNELGGRLGAAIDKLSDAHRAVIVLREVEGLSYDEIAGVLKIPSGTVMSRLHHARRRLRDELREYLAGDEPADRSPNP